MSANAICLHSFVVSSTFFRLFCICICLCFWCDRMTLLISIQNFSCFRHSVMWCIDRGINFWSVLIFNVMFMCQFEHSNDVWNNATHTHCVVHNCFASLRVRQPRAYSEIKWNASNFKFVCVCVCEIDGKIKVQQSIRSSMLLAAAFTFYLRSNASKSFWLVFVFIVLVHSFSHAFKTLIQI